ncbi:hypothetical protein IJG26_02925 [Candidatus Saccharibacteria bacterium]|nr:hypothetical protein [Candidatus Saccharibacteria bacterium]
MNDGMGEHDPNREWRESAKEDVRPEFLGGKHDDVESGNQVESDAPTYENDKRNEESKGFYRKNAKNELESAESSAENADLGGKEGDLSDVKDNEEKAGGLYSGSKETGNERGKKKRGFKGKIGRKTALFAIILSVFGVGGMMSVTQLFQPFSLIEQFRESFNSMHTSANIRSQVFFEYQMGAKTVKNPIKKVFTKDTFRITKKQSAKLAEQGIEYDDDYEGTGTRVLKFDDGSGETKIITADQKTANALKEKGVYAESFAEEYQNNSDFFNGYNKGSMTWRGQIANWFGTATAKFLEGNDLTRNLFADFIDRVNKSKDGNTKTVAQELIKSRSDDIEDGGMNVVGGEEATKRDGDGNVIETGEADFDDVNATNIESKLDNLVGESNADVSKSKINRSNMDAKVAASKITGISDSVKKGANVACTVMNTIGAVSLLVTASEALQIINLTTAFFEAVDKTKAGYGDETPINDFANALNDKMATTNNIVVSTGEAWNGSNEESNFLNGGLDGLKTLKTESVTTEKSAMQSSGVAALFSGGAVDPYDPSVQSFNLTASVKRIAGGIGTSMAAFEGCTLAKIATNAVSGISDGIKIAACLGGIAAAVATAGVASPAAVPACAGVIEMAGKMVVGIVKSVGMGMLIAGVIAYITPLATKMLTRDLVSQLGSEDLGNALTFGANMFLGNTHRFNGGSLATRDKYIQFAMAEREVMDEYAKYERMNRSPFDTTSKYTFMGTIMTKLMGFLPANSLMSTVTASNSVVSSAVASLSPNASAYDITKDLPDNETYAETCPFIASIGAVGDAYCNPYSITDMSTLGNDPSEVVNKLNDDGNFKDGETSDGNVIIDGSSDLAKYILYCDGRSSSFGIADQNIVSDVSDWGQMNTGNKKLDIAVNSAIGAIPVIGDTIDVVSNSDALFNMGYISGSSCVAGGSRPAAAIYSPTWDEAKEYQRFIEDQSLMESMGIIEESAVTAFLDEYYEENPLDNSYEGILARYSGLSKEDVVALLDFFEYADYLADYNPAERYAFGAPVVEIEHELLFDNESELANNYVVLLSQISYADVRNRSFAV